METLRDRYNESLKRIACLRESLGTAREEAVLAARSLTDFVVAPSSSSKTSSSSSSSSSLNSCSSSTSSRMSLHVSPPRNREEASSSSSGDTPGSSTAPVAPAAAAAAGSPEQEPAAAASAAAAGGAAGTAAARARKEWLQRIGLSRIATRNLRCYALNVERCVGDHRAFFESPEETLGLPPQRHQQKRSSSSSSSSSSAVPLKDTGEDIKNCAVVPTQEWEKYPHFDDWGTDPSGSILLRLNYLQVT
ncbi:hypothetical protein Emed_003203 [Eimeria media]